MAEEQDQVQYDPVDDPEADDLNDAERAMMRTWGWIVLGVFIIAGALIGWVTSQQVAPVPKIGIVRLYDVIDVSTIGFYMGPLELAAERDDVAGVVIFVDSPGGDAAFSEEMFYTILELRQNKPVVASTERFNASGAYYASVATNYIFASPAAQVGSIGVIGFLPDQPGFDEEIVITGPFKGSSRSQVDTMRDIESVKQAFLTNVYDQRVWVLDNMHDEPMSDLLPPREEIATGRVWNGAHALQIGLIDEIGSHRDAIAKAAELAGVSNYEVVDLVAEFLEFEDTSFPGFNGDGFDPNWYQNGPWAEYYHLYLMPEE